MQAKIDTQKLKEEVITEINRLRTNPKSYIQVLSDYLKCFDGNVLTKENLDGEEYEIDTQEGPAAYQNAIDFLKKQKPIKPISFDDELSKVSQSHADDLGTSELTGVQGSDGRDNYERVSEYIEWETFLAECIDFGGLTGKDVVISLLVDDGNPEKEHREFLFNDQCSCFGVGVSKHNSYDVCTVIDLVGEIKKYLKNRKKNVITTQKEAIKKMNYLVEDKDNKNLKDIDKFMKHQDKKNKLKNLKKDYEENMENLSEDEDAPEGAISCRIKVTHTKKGTKILTTTVKTYTLKDGSEEVVTLEEEE